MEQNQAWPPRDGRRFVHSEEFGSIVVEEARALAHLYPTLDLSDAVATVFQWFNSKLNANGHFINKRRFPYRSKFRAYVRQALYNAGQRAYRVRKSGGVIAALPAERPVVDSPALSLERKERLLKLVEQLEEPFKTVFFQYFFDEVPFYIIAGSISEDESTAHSIYEQSVDQIQALAEDSDVD